MFSIGIDFGGTTVKTGITKNGSLVHRGPVLATPTADKDKLLAEIFAAIAEFLVFWPELSCVGIGLPGMIDPERGLVHELSNVPGWENVPLRDIVHQATGLAVSIENDAKAMTYAEWKFGAGRGFSHLVCLTLGTGIGSGLVLNGQLYRGANSGAGEIGQMHYSSDGTPAGHYGNTGALEKMVGNKEITERATALYAARGRSADFQNGDPALLTQLANAGDTLAQELWATIGTEIGTVLADLVWLLNPQAIVIGGGVAKAAELLFRPIRETIARRTSTTIHESLKILPARLGNDAGIIGNAALALELR